MYLGELDSVLERQDPTPVKGLRPGVLRGAQHGLILRQGVSQRFK
jgi:hypothetical protein